MEIWGRYELFYGKAGLRVNIFFALNQLFAQGRSHLRRKSTEQTRDFFRKCDRQNLTFTRD
ncbi:MAG: hypothetical protein U7126_00435 [Microcoleus sp.]